MQEEKAVAILMANLKNSGAKPSKISDVALACRTLNVHPDWGTAKMSKYFDVAKTVLLELNRINDLEPEILAMADARKIGVSSAYQLTRVDTARRMEAAKMCQDMNRKEVRDLVFYLTKHPDMTVTEAKKRADGLKPKTVNILALPINDSLKKRLEKNASQNKQSLHDYVGFVLEKHG